MAVPGHDERDNAFAKKYELPIRFTTAENSFVNYGLEIKQDRSKYAMANSGEFDGVTLADARESIMVKLQNSGSGEHLVTYKIRDWLISRQRYWGSPIPVIHCAEHGAVPVPERQLPVVLPELEDYKPSGDGRSPLAKATEWLHAPCPTCGKMGERETDTMDGYVCSSWYQLRYADPNNAEQAWSPERVKHWLPVDFYNGGDHATAHLLYARFFTHFFHKLGLVENPEPFGRMYFHAKILAPDGTAFSKSKGNGVDPLEVINSGYGADALRTYIMFMAPPDVESPWNNDGVPGCYRFLNRVWVLSQEYLEKNEAQTPEASQNSLEVRILQSIHKAINKVTQDIEAVKLNTAISAMMECVNELYKLKDLDNFTSSSWKFTLESLLQILAPFAPHISEELWHQLGHEDSVHVGHWPTLDEKYLVEDEITLAVQVNGKVRAEITVSADAPQEDIMTLALSQENVQTHLAGREPKKVIYVPGKLVSIVG
jgi:leucyl-tRNA synthetase